MKPIKLVLVIVLIISGLLPLPVALASLFSPANAAAILQIQEMDEDAQKALLLNGCYMLSFMAMFWLSAWWLITGKASGYSLALVIGTITFFRGLLMICVFNRYGFHISAIANIAIADGAAIMLLSVAGRRSLKSVAGVEA